MVVEVGFDAAWVGCFWVGCFLHTVAPRPKKRCANQERQTKRLNIIDYYFEVSYLRIMMLSIPGTILQ